MLFGGERRWVGSGGGGRRCPGGSEPRRLLLLGVLGEFLHARGSLLGDEELALLLPREGCATCTRAGTVEATRQSNRERERGEKARRKIKTEKTDAQTDGGIKVSGGGGGGAAAGALVCFLLETVLVTTPSSMKKEPFTSDDKKPIEHLGTKTA